MTGCFYLIGASRVGKSAVAAHLARDGRVRHVELDDLVKDTRPSRPRIESAQDLDLVVKLLERIESASSDRTTLVVVGAGTQDLDRQHRASGFLDWLRRRSSRVIWVIEDPDVVYARWCTVQDEETHRARTRFDLLEFGPERTRLYEIAGHQVDSRERSLDEVAANVLELIQAAQGATQGGGERADEEEEEGPGKGEATLPAPGLKKP